MYRKKIELLCNYNRSRPKSRGNCGAEADNVSVASPKDQSSSPNVPSAGIVERRSQYYVYVETKTNALLNNAIGKSIAKRNFCQRIDYSIACS